MQQWDGEVTNHVRAGRLKVLVYHSDGRKIDPQRFVCVCVYACLHVCVCVRVCVYAHMCGSVHACVSVYMRARA